MTGNTYCMSSSTTAAMRMRAKMSLTNQLSGSRRQLNAYFLCTTVLSDLVVCLRILDALRRSVLGGGPVGEFGVGDVALPGREHRVARRHRQDPVLALVLGLIGERRAYVDGSGQDDVEVPECLRVEVGLRLDDDLSAGAQRRDLIDRFAVGRSVAGHGEGADSAGQRRVRVAAHAHPVGHGFKVDA